MVVPIIAVSILFPATIDETTGMSSGPNLVGSLIGAAIVGAYFVLMESSAKQASLGKMALGLKVTTMDGGRLSLGQAAVRAWPFYLGGLAGAADALVGTGMILSLIVGVAALIALLVIAFSSNKQGLHDKMAGALVVKK